MTDTVKQPPLIETSSPEFDIEFDILMEIRAGSNK